MFVNWRGFLVSEIQDKLRHDFKFYETEIKNYFDKELFKLLKKIDFMFANYINENLLKYTL